jgi:hypothetical protein
LRLATEERMRSANLSQEYLYNAAVLKQIGAQIEIPPPTGAMKPAAFTLDDTALLGHAKAFE